MAYSLETIEKRREYDRNYQRTNRKRLNEDARNRYAANPEPAKERNRKYHKNNPEKIKEINRKYQETHPEYNHQYYKDHIEAEKEGSRLYCRANPEKEKARKVRYRKIYPNRVNAYNAKRRAQKLQATPAWADHEIIGAFYKIAHAFGLVVDHIIPLQNKDVCGLHVQHNLQLLTREENSRKGNKLLEIYNEDIVL